MSGRLARANAAAEQRFEGIALTGRNVVFLVDMSGSMDLVDERTPDPAKWSGVRDAVQKIMHSLPRLERFQVILFSDRIPIYSAATASGSRTMRKAAPSK